MAPPAAWDDREADVAVVGAGLAGLAAARDLVAAERSVVVLEARPRVGGRLHDAVLEGGDVVELGGQWIGPTQDRIAAAAADVGVATHPTHAGGANLIRVGDRTRRYSGSIPRLRPTALLDLAVVRRRLERLAKGVPLDEPWRADGADRLDAETLGGWLLRNSRSRTTRTVFAIAARTIWGAEPGELSLLHVLFYVRAAGGLDALVDVEGGAQQDRLEGGAQIVAARMAERLGDRILLAAPVRRVTHGLGGVRIHADATHIAARRAIVAIPPPLAGRIAYEPGLTAARDGLTQRMPQGSIAKVAAVYREPFWRSDGLSGEALGDEGPVTMTFDNSPPGGTPGVLIGFVGGREARAYARLCERDRRATALASLVRLFGSAAAAPDEWLEQTWDAEEWSGGGPTCYMPPGGWTGYGRALREPVGPIHWAGTETATTWCGYMDGAIRSGERAAREVHAELG